MFKGNFLAILLLFCRGFQSIFLRNVFVSHSGQDVISCGNSSCPCRSVRFAVNVSNSGDVILIDRAQGRPYKECENCKSLKFAIELNKPLSFTGINGKAVIHCRRSCDLFVIRVKRYTSSGTKIKFANVIISRTHIAIRSSKANFELVFERCILKSNFIGVHIIRSTQCSIRTFNSTFEKSRAWAIWTKCISLTAHFVSTSFKTSPVALQTIYKSRGHWQITEVFISSCDFDGKRKQLYGCNELLIIKPYAMVVNITVDSSKFRNHYGKCQKSKNTLSIVDSSNGKREVTLIALNKLYVENNYSPRAAIKLVPYYKVKTFFKIELLNSVFRNNTGSLVVRMKNSLSPRGASILLTNNTFLTNNYIDGVIHLPAITFYAGRMHIIFCRFLNNVPGDLPNSAVITILDFAEVYFKDCYYETSRVSGRSLQFYAMPRSRLTFAGNNTFNIVNLKSAEQIFLHMPLQRPKGNLGTMRLQGILKILCPHGYILTSQSKCKVNKNQIVCTYLYSSCEPCPYKTYSLKRGELYNNIALQIQCYNCPRGGQCEGGQVIAKPNFWGYRKKEMVSFLTCPPEYCCDTENCNSYNGCHGNRTGALCGQCPEGMSEPLFNTNCKSNEECTSFLFWPGVSCLIILYLIFFLYHEEITRFVRKGLSLKRPSILRIRERKLQNSNEHISPENNQNRDSKGSGFLKIIFYYYQIVHVFRNCVGSHRNRQKILVKVEKIFSRALNLIVVNIPSFDCPFKNLRPVQKAVILHSVGYCLLTVVVLVYLFTAFFRIIKTLRNRVKSHNQSQTLEILGTADRTQRSTSRFSARIVSAFTYISLLMYASSAQLCLSLLHCVPVGDFQVLFIDGTIKCYQTFQYVLLVYVVFSILPFCLVPVLGSYLLKLGAISVPHFCISCVFPLPFVCYWVYFFLKNYSWNQGRGYEPIDQEPGITTTDDSDDTPFRKAILRVLLGPFRRHKSVLCFPASFLPWEGFLIFRRLVLIIVLTFIYDNRLRMMLALIICVAILLSHMYVHPFINAHENFLESLSLSTLIVLCGFTLVKALYQGEDFSSSTNSLSLLKAFDMVEDILIVTPLAIVIFIVILSFLQRLMSGFRFCIRLSRVCTGR